MTTAFPIPSFRPKHMERQRNVCSGEICTAHKATCHNSTTQGLLQLEIPPLRMLRWRSTCFGRNDGGQVRHYNRSIQHW